MLELVVMKQFIFHHMYQTEKFNSKSLQVEFVFEQTMHVMNYLHAEKSSKLNIRYRGSTVKMSMNTQISKY